MPYTYYIIDHALPARADDDTWQAEVLTREGNWNPTDFYKAVTNGRVVSEEEALEFWARYKRSR